MSRTPILASVAYSPPPVDSPKPRVSPTNTGLWVAALAGLLVALGATGWGIYAILSTPAPRPVEVVAAETIAAPEPEPIAPVTPAPASPTPVPEIKPVGYEPPPPKPASPAPTPPAEIQPKPPTPMPAPPPLVITKALTEEQKRINAAIDRGVEYLKKSQRPAGMWGPSNTGRHVVGHAALPGLALLECQVKKDDPVVQNAAGVVRLHAAQLNTTYDLALAILFLDRLGDPKDVALIQTFALRLIGGQNAAGGWDYHCPIIPPQDSKKLLTFLQATQAKLADPLKAEQKLGDPLKAGERAPLNQAMEKDKPKNLVTPISGEANRSAPENMARSPVNPALVGPPAPGTPAMIAKLTPSPAPKAAPRLDSLPQHIRQLPVLMFTKKVGLVANARDDNSNTQFALLGLWAARRHDVPTDKSLAIADLRFQKSQNRDGGWGYQVHQASRNTMTCVGLLGLAMGHGTAETAKPKAQEDNHINRGLKLLGDYLSKDMTLGRNEFYFLWSVERVGMLYNQKTIGNTDWYKWGSGIILPKQTPDGSWTEQYDPAIDTSFALLFLKRSNLVQDLTNRLQLYLAITNPDSSAGQTTRR